MAERPHRHLSGEALRNALKRADRGVSAEVHRLHLIDPQFRAALKLSLDLEDEAAARKNQGGE